MASKRPAFAPRSRHAASAPERLPFVTRAFHWASVLLLVAMFALVWTAGRLDPGPVAVALINLHRSVGLTLLVLVLLRLCWRAGHQLPPLPGPRWERWLASAVQASLYLCLLAMPLIGFAASDMAGDTVRVYGLATLPNLLPMDEDWSDRLFVLHRQVATALLVLAGLHVAGALRHLLLKRDGVAERMF